MKRKQIVQMCRSILFAELANIMGGKYEKLKLHSTTFQNLFHEKKKYIKGVINSAYNNR